MNPVHSGYIQQVLPVALNQISNILAASSEINLACSINISISRVVLAYSFIKSLFGCLGFFSVLHFLQISFPKPYFEAFSY